MARRTSASAPPTMMLRVPLAAPSLPPDTGASSMATPCSASRAAMRRVACGLIVDMSTTREPGLAPCTTPPSPSSTCSTSGVSLTQTSTTSLEAASSAGLPAVAAPASASGCIRSGVRLWTVRSKPASSRLRLMPRPMIPSPMKPTRSLMVLIVPGASQSGGGAWVGDLRAGEDGDQVGEAGAEGAAERGGDGVRGGDQLAGAAERPRHLVVAAAGLQLGRHVVAVQPAHRVLLEPPGAVVAAHHHHRQAVADQRVHVHQRQARRAVAEQQHDLRARAGRAGGDRVAQAGAEAAVGAGVQPRARPGGLDVAAGERDEVAAVADHHGVVAEQLAELPVDPGRVDGVGVARQQLPVGLLGPAGRLPQALDPALRARPAAVPLGGGGQAVEHQAEVTGDRAGERGVRGELPRAVGQVHDVRRGAALAAERAVAEPEVERRAGHDHQVGGAEGERAGARDQQLVAARQHAAGARPPSTSSDEPLNQAVVTALTLLVTPGPAVTTARPGARVSLAMPSAANTAVCSCRTSTSGSGGSALTAPSYSGNTCPPERVNIALTPWRLAAATARAPPCPSSLCCVPVRVASPMVRSSPRPVPIRSDPIRPLPRACPDLLRALMLPPVVTVRKEPGMGEGSTYGVWGWGRPPRPRRPTAPATGSAAPTGTWSAACAAASTTRPIWCCALAARPRSRPRSTGAAAPAWRWSPSAAARAWWAGSRRTSATASPGWSRWTWGAWPAWPRSTRSPAPPGCARAPPAPRSRTSFARTASPCASSRSRSSAPPWAAGSPPARPATTPPARYTSTTWSSPSPW